MTPPDWQLPGGVDRGLADYFEAEAMVEGYEDTIRANPLALADIALCERLFTPGGRVIDLGSGTGRLARHFAARGHAVTAVDLSPLMLAEGRRLAAESGLTIDWVQANLAEWRRKGREPYDDAACLFSTWGMVRGRDHRARALENFHNALRPGGRLVLHAHHRFFEGLGTRRVWHQRWQTLVSHPDAGDITMSQSYGGAPLTLYHTTARDLTRSLESAGFRIEALHAVAADGSTGPRVSGRTYGFLAVAVRPASTR